MVVGVFHFDLLLSRDSVLCDFGFVVNGYKLLLMLVIDLLFFMFMKKEVWIQS